MTGDPFATASQRERVFAAWVASPARFREDANAEDDFARTAYRDRLVVELAQNAADAAARAGVPGRLALRLTEHALYAANAGAPLDAAGVEALSHLRVSTKGPEDVGRYGVGFKAVLAITDEPAIAGRDGGVRWSRAETSRLVNEVATPELAAEVSRRDGSVPAMRLPFPATPDATARALLDHWDTVVVLPFRDAEAAEAARRLVAEFDPTLLLFLPGLDEVTAGDRFVRASRDGDVVRLTDDDTETAWRVHANGGRLDPALLAGRPVEERERAGWSVAWAVPLDAGRLARPYDGDRRLRAPQPTDEPLGLPALLAATFPLDPGRRHVVTGPLASWLVERAAEAYAGLLAALPPAPSLADLLPAGFPAGSLDHALREALAAALPRARWLAAAGEPERRLRPDETAVVDLGPASEAVTALLAPAFPALASPRWAAGHRRAALAGLGVRVLETADLVDLLHGVEREPAWWASLYAALASAPDRDALRALPVPLRDGRTVTGPRGLVLPASGAGALADAVADAGLPVRFVHPDCATGPAAGLLRSLGANDLDPGVLLDDLREPVERSLDDDPPVEPDALAAVVLALLAVAPGAATGRAWLGELGLPDASGDPRPAGELLLPPAYGGRLAGMVAGDSPFALLDEAVVERHGVEAVTAAGVLATFATVRDADMPVDAELAPDHYLDGADDWLDDLDALAGSPDEAPATLAELVAVRDLEWVRRDTAAWSAAWELLAALREPVFEPVLLVLPDGGRARGPAYTTWWLATHDCVPTASGELLPPRATRLPEAGGPLAPLFAVAALDGAARARAVAAGVLAGDTLAPEHLAWALGALPGSALDGAALREAYTRLAAAAAGVDVAVTPARVRALRDGEAVTVATGDAVVVDRPDLLPLARGRATVPVPAEAAATLAALLGVPLATHAWPAPVVSRAARHEPWPDGLARLLPGAALPGDGYDVHDPLIVTGADGDARVPWRVAGGVASVDAGAGAAAVGRVIAWLAGEWGRRDTVAAWLAADAVTRAAIEAESALD